jgi:heat-inducible transcriptional repressor
MKAPKSTEKKASKKEREEKILIGLVDYYLKSGKPVGSDTLRETGFQALSSATIRNYFVLLEKEGYLLQQHTSGGRIPTDKAFRLYAASCLEEMKSAKREHIPLTVFSMSEEGEIKEVISYLEKITAEVSEMTGCASFLSAPRFDQDYVIDMKLISFEGGRLLAALLTNFGLIHTEILLSPEKLSAHTLKKMESYFRARLSVSQLPVGELEKDELELAHRFYQEAMARYLVRYSHFMEEDLYRAGFSKLLRYPEFQDARSLASSLSLFENRKALNELIRETQKTKDGAIKYWIGNDLFSHLSGECNCAVVATAYHIGERPVGSLGIIGPMRLDYRKVFSVLQEAESSISKCLAGSLMKYKITFRTPSAQGLEFIHEKRLLIENQQEG